MTEHNNSITDAEALRRALLAIHRAILDAEPVEALHRIDRLLDELAAYCEAN